MQLFLHRQVARFRVWWHAPITLRDRLLGLLVGAFAGFWIGLLLPIALFGATGATPLLFWIFGSVVAFALAGILFPKHWTVVLFPLALFGPG